MPRNRIYFISDAHLGTRLSGRSNRDQEESLVTFLRSIRKDAEVLYIVGDLFDFWFEYRTVVPARAGKVLFALHALVQNGVRVVYLPGNHDIWLGDYLSEQVGLHLPGGPVAVEHQGRRVYVTHGDELRENWKARLKRWILKNPVCIVLFRLLHPDLGAFLASTTSRLSNYRSRSIANPTREIPVPVIRAKITRGFDIMVCGHFHRPLQARMDGGTFVVLGDWLYDDHYAVMENGEISLKKWSSP